MSDAPLSGDMDRVCQVSYEQLAKLYDIDNLALSEGEHDLPRSKAKSLGSVERKIAADIEKRIYQVTTIANDKLVSYNTTLSNTDLNDEQQRITNMAEANKLKLESLIAEDEQTLGGMRENLERNRHHFNLFKQENRLRDDARYPESKTLYLSFAFLIFLIESVANGFFFAAGSEFGLLGGVSQAVIIAFINVVPAYFLIGVVVLRYKNHISPVKKGLSYIVLPVYMGWTILFNFVIAHYRDLYAVNPESAVSLALENFMGNPFGLADINSWMLFLMGIIFSAIAAIDGMLSDDRYPEYGKWQRRLDEMQADYDEESHRMSKKFEAVRSEFMSEMGRLEDKVMDEFTHAFHLAKTKPALVERYTNCINSLQTLGDALIHRYRSENSKYRSTPEPQYYEETWKPNLSHELKGAHSDDAHIRRQKELFDGFPEFVQKTSNEIETIYAGYFKRIKSLEQDCIANEQGTAQAA